MTLVIDLLKKVIFHNGCFMVNTTFRICTVKAEIIYINLQADQQVFIGRLESESSLVSLSESSNLWVPTLAAQPGLRL